jgi:hypothetical protein
MERGPLNQVAKIEEQFGRSSSGCDLEIENTNVGIRHADQMALSFRKNWH